MQARMASPLIIFGLLFVVTCSAQQFFGSTLFGKREDTGARTKMTVESNNRQGRSQAKVDLALRNDRFFMGSRYGKRNSGSGVSLTEEPNAQPVSSSRMSRSWEDSNSRVDAFFLGSRYGKRAENSPGDDPLFSPQTENAKYVVEEKVLPLSCVYAGMPSLYYCVVSLH